MSRVLFGPSLSVNLAFLCGYADTVAFVHMKGLFVAHITGNFVLLGASFVAFGTDHGLGAGDLLKMLAFPVFLVSAGLAAVLAGFIPKARQTPVLLWLTAILVATVGAGAWWPGQWDTWLAIVGFAVGCALGTGSQLLMGFGAMLLALVLAYRLWRG